MSRSPALANDPVARAIAAAGQPKGASQPRVGANVQLSTGRLVQINLPADLTEVELLDLVMEVSGNLRRQIAAQRPASRIVVPRK